MKQFQFSLETLLSLRREKERVCEIALAQRVGELHRINARIEAARRIGMEAFEYSMHSLDDLILREGRWNKSMNEEKALESSKIGAIRKVDEAREKYNEAHALKLSLERLKDKQLARWRQKVQREEIKRLDETAMSIVRKKSLVGETL